MRQQPERKSASDAAYEVGRGVVSALPVAGGPLQVMFENVFTSPIEKRKSEWLNELASVIEEIGRRVEGFETASLRDNDAFVTTAMQATQIALRNHQREKLDALRNAVLNSGLPGSLSDDEQATFVRLIDDLTPWHLRLLIFFDDPARWVEEHDVKHPDWYSGGAADVLEACFPDMQGHRDIYDQMVRDLQGYGLLAAGSYLQATMTVGGMMSSRTTTISKRFIAFISAPSPVDI